MTAENKTINQLKEREAILEMDNTAQQNVQDAFLNNLRKDRVNVTIYLMGGVKLRNRNGLANRTFSSVEPRMRFSSASM